MKKVVVLHAKAPFMWGGAEVMVSGLTRQLKLHGFDTELISMPFKWYPNNTLLDSYLMWRMPDLTETNGERIDLVIPTKAPTYMINHPNKVIWLMHQHRAAYDLKNNASLFGLNTIEGGQGVIREIEKMDYVGITEAQQVFTISQNVSARLKKYNSISSVPLYHPPGLAGRYYSETYGDYILSVGRLSSEKRVDLLIRALPYCDKRIHAVIAGKGPEQAQLQKMAEELNVADRVIFAGFVKDDELLNLYANALAVCFLPIDEDYGYITLEAFLSKRPLLSCEDSGCVLEFAQQEQSAFITEPDPKMLAEQMQKLYKNKSMARDMGHSGYEAVKDISWDTVVDELTKSIR